MDMQRWTQLRYLFDGAVEVPERQWDAFLRDHTDDESLQREVLSLLRMDLALRTSDARKGRGTSSAVAMAALVACTPDDPRIGCIVRGWRIRRLLGRGSSGAVYLCECTRSPGVRLAAIKFPHADADGLAMRRLRIEHDVLRDTDLPGVVRLIDAVLDDAEPGDAAQDESRRSHPARESPERSASSRGDSRNADATRVGTANIDVARSVAARGLATSGRVAQRDIAECCLVFDLVDGRDLHRHNAVFGLDPCARLRLFLRVCGIVVQLHARGIVHGDLRAQNILVSGAGEVTLLDFGRAVRLSPPGAHATAIAAVGVPAFDGRRAGPEPADALVSIACDVTALTRLLAELCDWNALAVSATGGAPAPASESLAIVVGRVLHTRHANVATLAWRLDASLRSLGLDGGSVARSASPTMDMEIPTA